MDNFTIFALAFDIRESTRWEQKSTVQVAKLKNWPTFVLHDLYTVPLVPGLKVFLTFRTVQRTGTKSTDPPWMGSRPTGILPTAACLRATASWDGEPTPREIDKSSNKGATRHVHSGSAIEEVQSGASYLSPSLSQGFEDVLGSSSGWLADTVATYCPGRPSQLTWKNITKPCDR